MYLTDYPINLIYGSGDRVIGLSAIEDTKTLLGSSAVHNVGPVGHAAERAQEFWAYEPFIDDFLRGCSLQNASANHVNAD
jgi:hypothetical protein